ncbi:hypothetical protein COCCADRAFT_93869, partial [Bipolaris zeicola 26-R-13]
KPRDCPFCRSYLIRALYTHPQTNSTRASFESLGNYPIFISGRTTQQCPTKDTIKAKALLSTPSKGTFHPASRRACYLGNPF